MTAALLWLRAHKQFALFAGAILAVFTSGYCAGRRSVSQPAVHEVEQEHATATVNSQVDTTAHAGPKHSVTYNFDPVGPPAPPGLGNRGVVSFPEQRGTPADICRPVMVPGLGAVQAPPGERLESVTIEDDGASDTETHATTEAHQEQDRKLDLTISPATLARSLALGVEDPFGEKKLHIEGAVMVTQHVGARLGWTPANGLLKGLTPMAEFRF